MPEKIDVLLIGSGGREHALAWKLSQSPQVGHIYASPGSSAIAAMAAAASCVPLSSHEEIIAFAKTKGVGLTVIGPEVPLVEGLTDQMEAAGLKVFGPSQAAAQLEGSKAFAKAFMEQFHIPTSPFVVFTDAKSALKHLETLPPPYVIKADGLAAGKGVVICENQKAAIAAIDSMMGEKVFGDAGAQVVIEGFLSGEEASYFVISDGTDYISLTSTQDHKPIGELDTGPNTGGMGAYGPAPVVSDEVEKKVLERIVEPTLKGMATNGHPYRGVLYVGLMIDHLGDPYVVEYNCRFGDPECQPLMMLLESDLMEIFMGVVEGEIKTVKPVWRKGSAACMVMASAGYPGNYTTGCTISGLETKPEGSKPADVQVFHAGTTIENNIWKTKGGRVLGITAWGENLSKALETGYQALSGITFEGATYRRDIGIKGLKRENTDRPEINVGIVIGSASDMNIAQKATDVLESLGIRYRLAVSSAHRTPERTRKFIEETENKGAEVFIAIAGMAAALPGVVAAETLKPVVGVPVDASPMGGLDALLSIAQMPPGIPVATVAVGGGVNAAVLAAEILALKYSDVQAALKEYRIGQQQKVEEGHRKAGLEEI